MASPIVELLSAVLLFSLVFGMSATVEISHMRKQIHNSTALLIGAGLQFVILPFVGFLTVKIFALPAQVGITLLVITSSPGGSYSNWWCSMFNADLALSVTMTALSTLLSTLMLPANLVIYTRWTYSEAVVKSLDWTALFVSLAVVIGGIGAGLSASHWANHRDTNSNNNTTAGNNNNNNDASVTMRRRANRMGNLSGLALILLSVTVSSSDHQAALWDQDASFYAACAFPPILGLILAVSLATYYQLDKPERVAVSIESCYQNTGIATTVALTMFKTEAELATAIGVPLMYGIVEGVVILTFCLICWKSGWTKAPVNENLCTVIATSYEVECCEDKEQEATSIEVVLSSHHKGGGDKHLIFSQTDAGDYVVDEGTLQEIEKDELQKQQPSTTVGWDGENQTECSESDQPENDVEESDGIMITGTPVQRRRRRCYDALEAPGSPTTTDASSVTSDCDQVVTADNISSSIIEPNHQQEKIRFGRRTISSIRARATGYRPQAPLTHEDDEHDDNLHSRPRDTQLSIVVDEDAAAATNNNNSEQQPSKAKAAVTMVAASSKSAVTKVAASVSNRRARRNYETVATTASPSNQQESAEVSMEGGAATESSDGAPDDISL